MPTKGGPGTTSKSRSSTSKSATPKAHRPPDDLKSPQPQLSDSATNELRDWLNNNPVNPFGIATLPNSKKRKRESSTYQAQEDLWEDRLSVLYEVRPKGRWDNLRKYKKFTVGTESIGAGECVLIKHEETGEGDQRIDIAAQWKARVLEVRALDQEHVYLRVAWLNRPEDLAGGRKPYHGRNELIPTNQLDVIDAMAVNGVLDVVHWKDDDDSAAMIAEDQYFWRQTFDYANTRTFSKLRQICIDRQPHNPDELIIQCSQENCRKWLHVRCIADNAVQQAYDEFHPPSAKSAQKSSKETPSRTTTTTAAATKSASPALDAQISALSLAQARAQKHGFTAEVYIKGLPSSSNTAAISSSTTDPVSSSTLKADDDDQNPHQSPASPNDPDAKPATPDRGLRHTVANAFTNVLSAVTAGASAAADKVVTTATATAMAPTTNDEGLATTTPAPAGANTVVLTRPDGSKKVEPLRCLFCAGKIED